MYSFNASFVTQLKLEIDSEVQNTYLAAQQLLRFWDEAKNDLACIRNQTSIENKMPYLKRMEEAQQGATNCLANCSQAVMRLGEWVKFLHMSVFGRPSYLDLCTMMTDGLAKAMQHNMRASQRASQLTDLWRNAVVELKEPPAG